MLNLTPTAAEQILNAATVQQDGMQSAPCLRVAAKIEDGEIVYGMGFDDERENDAVIEAAGVTLLIAPRSQELLAGATLDFVELKPGEFQFIFINPNEPSACGGSQLPQGAQGGCGGCGKRGPGCN
ncbi:MAG: iron-sulfur cluster biosynthesis family protein [Pseudomonadota bacterium]